ncbi:MAG: FAD-binding protein [Gammaproteobacteria bacterium]|nr:FAD-binding protein [Gammaproteobacteria bacterium]
MTHDITLVGAGMCGMFSALAMAQKGHQVTIFERDSVPPAGDADKAFFEWERKGAAQFRHPHAFLGLMCNLIQQHHPELLARFQEAGARIVTLEEMLPPKLRNRYTAAPGDEKLWVLLCRRATMETVVRRYVENIENVRIVSDRTVTGLLVNEHDGQLDITGVELGERTGGHEPARHNSELVVDASGRTSKFPGWLAKLGRPVREEKEDAEIVYFTKHFRLRPGEREPTRSERPGAGDLGYLKFGVFPGENGHFAIILCVPLGENVLRRAVRDTGLFDQICLNIPGLTPWLENARSEATTEPFGIGDIKSVWRHFVTDGHPLATNFFAVGDAALRTNPLYGRGCSTGIKHAQLLAEVIEENRDPVTRELRFAERTEEELRPIFDASLREDRSGIKRARAVMEGRVLHRPDSLKKWFRLAFGDAVRAASREQLHVLRGVMKTFHLLEKPGDFLKDRRIQATIFRYMVRGRKRNAAARLQPGPSRAALHDLLGLSRPSRSPG